MAEGLNIPSRDALMLPDVLTEGDDLGMPLLPNASFLFSQIDDDPNSRKKRAGSRDINLHEDFTTSQFLQTNIESNEEMLEPMDEVDLGLDLGFDIEANPKNDLSIEFGRDAPPARQVEDDLISKLDIQIPTKDSIFDLGESNTSLNIDFGAETIRMADDDGIRVGNEDEDVEMYIGGHQDLVLPAVPPVNPERISESPLSDMEETVTANAKAEATTGHKLLNPNIVELEESKPEEQEIILQKPLQRARRQRKLQPDPTTELSSAQIKSLQSNRDKILRPLSFLPRDPGLLTLMQMQRNGTFITHILRGGRSESWAPELRKMLSLDTVRSLKRKRSSESGKIDSENSDEQGPTSKPRLEIEEEEDNTFLPDGNRAGLDHEENQNITLTRDNSIIELAEISHDRGEINPKYDDDHEAFITEPEIRSPTTNAGNMTALSEVEPVSFGTKHAVHLLRDHIGTEANVGNSVLFSEILSESSVSRTDATKLFFEILLLGTKDAIKVEQSGTILGAPICISAKEGLWRTWTEWEAGNHTDISSNSQ